MMKMKKKFNNREKKSPNFILEYLILIELDRLRVVVEAEVEKKQIQNKKIIMNSK